MVISSLCAMYYVAPSRGCYGALVPHWYMHTHIYTHLGLSKWTTTALYEEKIDCPSCVELSQITSLKSGGQEPLLQPGSSPSKGPFTIFSIVCAHVPMCPCVRVSGRLVCCFDLPFRAVAVVHNGLERQRNRTVLESAPSYLPCRPAGSQLCPAASVRECVPSLGSCLDFAFVCRNCLAHSQSVLTVELLR